MPTLLVFGARNLGRVLARELDVEGWRVAAVARTEETIAILRDEVPAAVGLIGDASKAEDVERIFADVGTVDLVVNAITTSPSFGGPVHGSHGRSSTSMTRARAHGRTSSSS